MSSVNETAGFFIAGSDTGVGKTVVACALAAGLRRRGFDVGVMKPVETGVGAATPDTPKNAEQGRDATGSGSAQTGRNRAPNLTGQRDSVSLREAAQVDDPLELIAPLQFSLPAAPSVAAKFESRRVDLERVLAAFAELQKRHALLLVESAGGLLSPFDDERSMADLAGELRLPVVLVTRAALGTIHHTRLCLEAARTRALRVAGVVISHTHGPLALGEAENLAFLRDELGELLWGELPFAPDSLQSFPAQTVRAGASPSTHPTASLRLQPSSRVGWLFSANVDFERGLIWERILSVLPKLERKFENKFAKS